jgi:phage protein U
MATYFAVLGELTFQIVGSPTSFASERKYDFAVHKVVESKPRLQWIANDLEEITFDLKFHLSFCNPKTQMDALVAAANAHRAMALVFGNGVHRGYFVIIGLGQAFEQLGGDGTLVSITAKVTLQEYVRDQAKLTKTPVPANPPIAVVKSPQTASTTGTAGVVGSPATSAGVTYSYAAVGPRNLLSTDALTTFSATGALPAGTSLGNYSPPSYQSPGVSALASNPAATGVSSPAAVADDYPATSTARMDTSGS